MRVRHFLPILALAFFLNHPAHGWESRASFGLGQEKQTFQDLEGAMGSTVSFEALGWSHLDAWHLPKVDLLKKWSIGAGIRSHGSGGAIGASRFFRLHSGSQIVLRFDPWQWELLCSPYLFQESGYLASRNGEFSRKGIGFTIGSKKTVISGERWAIVFGGYREWRKYHQTAFFDQEFKENSQRLWGASQGAEAGVTWDL